MELNSLDIHFPPIHPRWHLHDLEFWARIGQKRKENMYKANKFLKEKSNKKGALVGALGEEARERKISTELELLGHSRASIYF